MADIVLGRWKPEPGQAPEEVEIPGPGLYEADFAVPDWLVPNLDIGREAKFTHNGKTVTHIRSRVAGPILTVRFRVEETIDPTNYSPTTASLIPALTVGVVLRWFGVSILGLISVAVIKGVVDALREVRLLGEATGGLGLTALAVAGAFAIYAAAKGR